MIKKYCNENINENTNDITNDKINENLNDIKNDKVMTFLIKIIMIILINILVI